jgi:signal peptidase II
MQAARGAAVAAEAPPPSAQPGHRQPILLGITAAVVLVADIVSKLVVVAHLSHRGPVTVIPHVLQLTLTRNAGAAFSVGTGATILFTAVAVAVVAVIIRSVGSLASTGWAVSLGLLLGGALGNLSDRIFRAPGPFRGHVVDWIQLPHWPVFNVADMLIDAAVVLIIVQTWRGIGITGVRHPKS